MTARFRWHFAFTFFALLLTTSFLSAQVTIRKKAVDNDPAFAAQPKLVVGVVVDQMRFDYLSRFWDVYGEDGFKRLVGEGFLARNHHFGYAPTSTGPGHASVYTGTTPAMHGIIGNNWFDKEAGVEVYCAGDDSVESVGTTSDAGKNSPHRMKVSTITDELRLHHQMRSKVIAISLKDRGAVLPGGHTANAAYWFEGGTEGNWISSSYYLSELPEWVQEFNASDKAASYKRVWEPLGEPEDYQYSGLDNTPFEGVIDGEQLPVFPHDLPALWDENGSYGLLRITPFGNSLLMDFALEALKKEDLGRDDVTDFLAISFSSTDYVGHFYGVNSKEVQDTYMRLDQDLARLLKALDRQVGEGEYTLFLTADHGAVDVPAYLDSQKIPAGYPESEILEQRFMEFLQYKYGTSDIVRNISNNQVFLDHDFIRNLELEPGEVQEALAAELLSYDGIYKVYTAEQMQEGEYTEGLAQILQQGYNQKRSGDILYVFDPSFANYSQTGSTHGTAYIYDTHVPLIFYGNGVRPGTTYRKTRIKDIAPTLSSLLGIAFPSGTTGQPIGEILK